MEAVSGGKFSWKGVVATCSLIGLVTPLLQIAVVGSVTLVELLKSAAAGLVFSNCIGLLATGGGVLLWPKLRYFGTLTKGAAIIGTLLAAGVLGSLAACAILTLATIFPSGHFWAHYLSALRFALFITFTFGAGSWGFEELRDRLQQTTVLLRAQELDRQRLEKLAAEARLSSLESRIHPHFLFNALNSISSLVREDPALAERLIERMAALLRFSLDTAQMSLVPLGQELKIAQDYLEIEKVRFGDRLRYTVELKGEVNRVRVPPMSIQTLVENSIKHAIAPRRQGGAIRIRAFAARKSLVVEVWDSGSGFALESAPAGHGLDNLRARLKALFGYHAQLTVARRKGGASVVLIIMQNPAVAVA